MTIVDLVVTYFIGAVITSFGVTKPTHFHRCVLLWPLYWLYIVILGIRMALDDIQR